MRAWLGNPWVILGAVLALVAALAGAYFYGVGVGKDKVEAKWQKREAVINAATAEKIRLADARVLEAERKSAENVAAVSQDYQAKLQEKDDEKTRAIANARASGLYVTTKRPKACGDPLPEAGPAPGGRYGETRTELSDALAEHFIAEANRADKIVEQLTACQALAIANRNLIGQ